MAQRRGSRPSILGYATAFKAVCAKRIRVAVPIEARDTDIPTKDRIDSRLWGWAAIDRTLVARGVHGLSELSPTLPTKGSFPASARRSDMSDD
jgi:hypothetical protein